MSRLLKLCLVLAIMLFGLAFHLRNDQFIMLDYYSGGIELPFSLWLFLALTAGCGLGLLASLPVILGHRREISRLTRKMGLYETELNELRFSPVKDVKGWTSAG